MGGAKPTPQRGPRCNRQPDCGGSIVVNSVLRAGQVLTPRPRPVKGFSRRCFHQSKRLANQVEERVSAGLPQVRRRAAVRRPEPLRVSSAIYVYLD